jgi:hypothetical protein
MDDRSFCTQMAKLLIDCCGQSIERIADLEISHMF